MFRKLIDWYDDWEAEQIAVLERPELAQTIPPGYRRYCAEKLAAMSPIERRELRAFSLTYRGRRLWIAVAKLAAAFTLAGLLLAYVVGGKVGPVALVVIANLVGFSFVIGGIGSWFNPSEMVASKRKVVAGLMVGALVGGIGAYVGLTLAHGEPLAEIGPPLLRVIAIAMLGAPVCVGIPMLAISAMRRRQQAELAEQLRRDAERERLARELSESQLRMLRAQIEPHFLFNTLGAVQQLALDGAPRAAALTADLIAFLRASFSDMRCEQVSLASEFGVVESYLRVMAARLGTRLHFSMALPDALTQVPVPSMIVLTLVENAVKHGIEPALRGGEIAVSAAVSSSGVLVSVHDTGVGMSDTPGGGAGLDNVRRRLQLAYGEAATLTLREADPGLVAELLLPLERAEAA
ncbi:sensor histidine kinase [Massilia sp. Leaf139]|uniref:sensor histidine kinase n=1 Tax=Massilia sp. Leaf139 TaxID=1736272 RepID=UPI0006F3AB3B|nr:histidine kinase [Massilia sp. Leaf139]